MAAGTINTVVGSGTLITFPTLLAFGVPPVTANVSNTVGLVPGSLSGVVGYRRELAGQRARVLRLGSASLLGGIVGAVLLLVLPSSAFDAIVPVLILLGVLLVVFGPRIQRAVAARAESRGGIPDHGVWWVWPAVAAAGVYGGYFGAAQGVLLIAILGIGVADSMQRHTATKNVLALLVNARRGDRLHRRRGHRLGGRRPDRPRLGRRRPARRHGRAPAPARPATRRDRRRRRDRAGRAARLRGRCGDRSGPTQASSHVSTRGVHPGADGGPRQHDVVHGAVDRDRGDVPADGRGPAPDLLDVEDDVVGRGGLVGLLAEPGARRRQHQDRAGHVQPGVQLGVAAAYGAQPADVDRAGLERLPGQVVVPLAAVLDVQRATVDVADLARDLAHRPGRAEPFDGDAGGGTAEPGRSLHVEPRRVQHHRGQLGRASLVRPQRRRQATRRVRRHDDLAVPVALGDAPPGEVDLGEVLVQVGDVVGRLVLAQRPAVLAEVDGVEGVAAVGPPPGVLGVEEVVGEAVHVQHGTSVGPRRLERHQRGDHGPLAVGRERDRLHPVLRTEDVGLQRFRRHVATLVAAPTGFVVRPRGP